MVSPARAVGSPEESLASWIAASFPCECQPANLLYLLSFLFLPQLFPFAMRYYILHLTIVMTAMSQLFQNSSAGDIRLDASDGTTLNFKSPGNSQQEQAGNMVDRRTSDQTAVLAIAGATSPDSSNFGPLQPASSLTESKQAQPPLGLGDADIFQKIPDESTDIAQSCSALPHRRMLLRPRADSCSNIPSSTNYNPALYPGGEALYEKAKLWGVEQERKQCRFWLKTMCCNGPRAFPTDIKDCAECMFWFASKKYLCVFPTWCWRSFAQSCRRNLDVSQVGYTVVLVHRSVLLFLLPHSINFVAKHTIIPKAIIVYWHGSLRPFRENLGLPGP